MRRLFLSGSSLGSDLGSGFGGNSLGSLLALLAAASGFALCFLAALSGFLALLTLLAANLLLGSSVLLVAVTAATYHCNGSDQNNE